MISKIYHIADVHIRLVRRHKEYREVFQRLYDYIEQTKDENSVIYLGGDIVHNKIELSPELIDLTADFLRSCADLCPTILITGNHDCNLNSNRMDSLSPLVKSMGHPNLHYWKDSGIYELNGVAFAVFSVFDTPDKWPLASQIPQRYKTKIALHHGSITGAFTDAAYEIKTGITVEHFNGFDLGLLGDIHKTQFMDLNSRVAYCGSVIQQDHGEDYNGHGLLVWDLNNFKSEFVQIHNDFAYYTLECNDGAFETPMDLPQNLRLRIKHDGTKMEDLAMSLTALSKRHNILEMVKLRSNSIQFDFETRPALLGNARNVDYQNQLIAQVLRSLEDTLVSEQEITDVQELNRTINGLLPISTSRRNVVWNPIRLEFENMFSYGGSNSINFENFNGLIGLFEPNVSGKSSIFDVLCFALFDKTTRTGIASHILNNNKNTFYCKIEFEANRQRYFIERTGTKKKDGAVKVDVNFWTFDENGIRVNLNGEDRDKTNQQIRSYIGMYEDFVVTGFSSQYDNQSFVEKTQKDRKELLYKFLDIKVYDDLLKLAKEQGRDYQVLLKTLKHDELHVELSQIYAQIGAQRDILENAEQYTIDKKEWLKTQMAAVRELYKQVQDTNVSVADPLALDAQMEAITNKRQTLNKKSNEHGALATELTLQLNDLQTEIRNTKPESVLVQLQTRAKKATTAHKKTEAEIRSLERDLAHCILHKEKLSTHQYDPNCPFCANNAFVRDALVDIAKIPALEEQISTAKSNLQIIETEVKSIGAEINQHQIYNTKITQCNEIDNKIKLLNGQQQTIVYELNALKNKEDNINNDRLLYFKHKEQIDANNKLNTQISILNAEITNAEMEINGLETKYRSQLVALEKLNLKYEGVKEKLEQYAHYSKMNRIYDLYQSAVGRDGVPYKIIEQIIPVIEGEVNQILNSMVDFTVSLTAGADKYITANIVYNDRGTEKFWPVELTSGMERFILSLAFRTCLVELTNLPKSNFLVIDEGFGVLDNGNIMAIGNLFTYLKERHDFIICVSHLDTMRDMVDGHLKIGKREGYSHISV